MILTTERPEPSLGTRGHEGVPAGIPAAAVLVVWAVLIVVAWYVGERIEASGRRILLDSAPLTGHEEWRVTWRALGAATLLVTGVAFGPALARRLPWRLLLLASVLAAAVWALALALVEGWGGVTDPLLTPTQYLHDVDAVGSVGEFLRTYPERVDGYVAHVRSHPPGMLLTLWSLDRLGLGGAGWTAVLVIGAGASAVAAVLVAVRDVAGEAAARRAAPFLVLAPAALWVASTYDAFFAAVAAWGVTLVVLATGRRDRTGDGLALGGGALLGGAFLLSYGLVLVAAVPVAVAVGRGRLRALALASAGPAVAVGALAVAGFWWFEGLSIARRAYAGSIASTRPSWYFLFANLAALAIALGPAVVVAVTRLRDRRLWWLVGGALAAVAVADLSGLSKGEVERIWLPFTVWLLPAAAALVAHRRAWLTANAGTALLVQLGVHTVW